MRGLRLNEARRARGLRQDQTGPNASFGGDFETAFSAGSNSFGRSRSVPILPTSFAARKDLSSRSTARLIRPMMSAVAMRSGKSFCAIGAIAWLGSTTRKSTATLTASWTRSWRRWSGGRRCNRLRPIALPLTPALSPLGEERELARAAPSPLTPLPKGEGNHAARSWGDPRVKAAMETDADLSSLRSMGWPESP